jgi:hypothetical protein
MSGKDKDCDLLHVRIKRVRSRIVSSLRTGGMMGSICRYRTDPTEGGEQCPTGGGCSNFYTHVCPNLSAKCTAGAC